MRGFIVGFSLLISSFYAIAQPNIVQGPFKLDEEATVYIKSESDVNYPLAIYYESNGKSHKVESYETDGDEPHVETVFFTKLENKKNVIVLVSWHQKHPAEGMDGISYQVFGYTYDTSVLSVNPLVKNDQNLNGLDGEFDGKQLNFRYKSAAEIKQYLKSHYK